MGASLRTAWSASGATGASDSNVFVHEDVDFSYEEIYEIAARPKAAKLPSVGSLGRLLSAVCSRTVPSRPLGL